MLGAEAGGNMNQMIFIHGPGAGGCAESFVHHSNTIRAELLRVRSLMLLSMR